MANIREKGPYQWAVQIRRKGWPIQNATFRTKKDAQARARQVESEMHRGQFIDQGASREVTLGDLIRVYENETTAKRSGEDPRIAERSRLYRFLREEKELCAYAVSNLQPEHFEACRDRRLVQTVGRTGKRIKPGTVRRELTLLKRVIDYRKRRLCLPVNPVNTEDMKRPAVRDERDVRLTADERARLLSACDHARNIWLQPFVELGFETGARRGNLLRLSGRMSISTAARRSFAASRTAATRRSSSIMPIGLSPRAVQVLKALPRRHDNRVSPLSANALRPAFNRAREKAVGRRQNRPCVSRLGLPCSRGPPLPTSQERT